MADMYGLSYADMESVLGPMDEVRTARVQRPVSLGLGALCHAQCAPKSSRGSAPCPFREGEIGSLTSGRSMETGVDLLTRRRQPHRDSQIMIMANTRPSRRL